MIRENNSKYHVFKAADELKNAGSSPSVRKIRSMIGGGTDKIAQHLKAWRELQPSTDNLENTTPIERAVSAVYDAMLAELNQKHSEWASEQKLALEEANKVIANIERIAKDSIQTNKDLVNQISKQKASTQAAIEDLNQSEKRLAVERNKVENLVGIKTECDQHKEAAKLQAVEIAALTAKLASKSTHIELLKESLEKSNSELKATDKNYSEASIELSKASQALNGFEKDLSFSRAELKEADDKISSLILNLDDTKDKHRNERHKTELQDHKIDALKDKVKQLEVAAGKLSDDLKTAEENLEEREMYNSDLAKQLEALANTQKEKQ
jgi:chromosome segregation ATPase